MLKRQREQAKRDKKALKAERRAQRKNESDTPESDAVVDTQVEQA